MLLHPQLASSVAPHLFVLAAASCASFRLNERLHSSHTSTRQDVSLALAQLLSARQLTGVVQQVARLRQSALTKRTHAARRLLGQAQDGLSKC
jgi:hypothetical protein